MLSTHTAGQGRMVIDWGFFIPNKIRNAHTHTPAHIKLRSGRGGMGRLLRALSLSVSRALVQPRAGGSLLPPKPRATPSVCLGHNVCMYHHTRTDKHEVHRRMAATSG